MRLFCDCKTDEEKSNFFLSGRAVKTGVIAPAISNNVAMAYHRCAQFKKENYALRTKIGAMEQQKPVAWVRKIGLDLPSVGCVTDLKYRPSDIPESSYIPLYLAPQPIKQKDTGDLQDLVSKALNRAWQLGKIYWQQVDSEYQSQWKKGEATQEKFNLLAEETRAAIDEAMEES